MATTTPIAATNYVSKTDNSSIPGNGFHIAIASGKGGTGKTFLATSLFYTLKQHLPKTTLVDCDAEEPNDALFFKYQTVEKTQVLQKKPVIDTSKCVFCGKCHEYCNYNAIFIIPPSRIIQIIEDLCHGCGACLFACHFKAITEKEVSLGEVTLLKSGDKASIIEGRMNVGIYSPVPVIKAAIQKSIGNDIVILDAPPGTSCPFIQTVNKADYIVLITEPTPFGLSDLKQSVDTLKGMGKQFGVIINRADMGNSLVHDYLKKENIPLLMEIPFKREIAECYAKGDLYAIENPQWQKDLMELFEKIKKYGNSGNQR